MPRFGPVCQYEFDFHYSDHSSLYEIIDDFYRVYEYNPTTFTCYTHLKCDRGPLPSCLDWSEICNGQVDCLDGGFDEEHCWQLEINQCKDNEYRCRNGQCIPESFYQDYKRVLIADCIDTSDEPPSYSHVEEFCQSHDKPSFACEDMSCKGEPLTSSCVKKRADLLMETMYSSKDNSIFQNCWSAFKCLLKFTNSEYSSCAEFCKHDACIEIIRNTCPDMLYFPNVPVLFGNIYFAYRKNDLQEWNSLNRWPLYICYEKSQYDDFFINVPKIFFNNMICVHSEPFLSPRILEYFPVSALHIDSIHELYGLVKRYHLTFNYTSAICNKPNMYQCVRSSKCISIHRLLDTVSDCPYMDDENITVMNNIDLTERLTKTHFKCQTSNKYIHQSFVGNDFCDCGYTEDGWCEDEDELINYLKWNIVFQHICDGFIDLFPITIAGRNETDETECEQWQCNNIYTRCNNVWNCPNGADESGCLPHSTLNCSSKHHLCVSPHTNQFICLPIEKANDGNVDCLGATDEPTRCESKTQIQPSNMLFVGGFYCMNRSSELCIGNSQLCDGNNDCEHGDDEQFCTTNGTSAIDSDVEKFLYDYHVSTRRWHVIRFKLDGMTNLPANDMKNMENTLSSSSSMIKMSDQHQSRCHRGLDLRIWLNNTNNLTINACLCPSSFYGNQCQYQNQRISLTIQFRALANSLQTLFAIIISLIDDSDERIIHSYEQVTFLSIRDCNMKFNMYLLYSTRPKDPTKHYSIHIDIYEKVSLTYRGSLLLPVTFPFLPVHRLAFIVDIPRTDDNNIQSCSNDQCNHGKCIKYSNNPENVTFCQCDEGWSGRFCTIQHICTCASDSLCIGISANNRSICVCPINKYGPRCLLTDTICDEINTNSTCQNGGQCISNVDYMTSDENFVCICSKGFTGDRCEIADNQLILSFGKDLVLSQQMFIHFIEVDHYLPVSMHSIVRATTFRTIPFRQDKVVIYWSRPFHLVFTELFNKSYYLTIIQKTYNRSTTIDKTINPSDRCPHISELFNESFAQLHLLRRIKSYHLPCQRQLLNLSCFYDDVHFCLCYNFRQQRLADCFKFDHQMTFDCRGQSECENGAQCLQDKSDCPTKSLCICSPCFYGTRCQFSTSGFGLSLDAILGYHILSSISLNYQPSIVKFSLALTIIFMVVGFINGICSLITFKNKIVREVGCGLYLLGSSITTLLIMLMFGLKFLIFLLAQMTIISNRSFLLFQCHSMDFVLRVCLCMDQWLNACVAAERAMTMVKGPRFVKKKSKQAARLVIILLLIVNVGSSIHDPIYRRLIDEENDTDDVKRIWCVINYPSSLQIYNSTMHIFHFFGPFMINLISAAILITKKSAQQSNVHKQRPYKENLREQCQQHKHLFIAPVLLVILAVPRLIITFVSKCMKSPNDSWLFLVGYFISFIPPMLTFVVFILPSKFYKKEFHKSVAYYRTNIQRHLHCILQR
jgi:hypothetical protein